MGRSPEELAVMSRNFRFLCVLALVIPACLSAAPSRADLDKIVDFSVTLKGLAAVAGGEAALPSRIFVIDGTVSDITILDKDKATFRVRIELLSGEWVETEDVKSYSCFVEFRGPEFFEVFPARAPRTATPGVVLANQRVLVAGRAIGFTTSPKGERRVLVEGLHVRTIR
jgi:hypothetical protein